MEKRETQNYKKEEGVEKGKEDVRGRAKGENERKKRERKQTEGKRVKSR